MVTLCRVQELVWILHKALEASQLEKRTCAEFLAETGEQERLELLRHRERQAADLRGQLEEVKAEAEVLRKGLAQREAQLSELQDDIRMLTEKNKAKQEVRTAGGQVEHKHLNRHPWTKCHCPTDEAFCSFNILVLVSITA